MFHYNLLMFKLAMSSNNTPKEQPVQATSVIHDDDSILTLGCFVSSHNNLHSKHQLCIKKGKRLGLHVQDKQPNHLCPGLNSSIV